MGYVSLFRAMSHAMQPQKPAGSGKTQLYIAINGQQSGPFTKTELIQLVKNGTLTADTYVWEAGMANWATAATLPHVNKLLLLHSPKRAKKSADAPKAEHPLRKDLTEAMAQLGCKGAEITHAIDALLASRPDIQISEAIKILLQRK